MVCYFRKVFFCMISVLAVTEPLKFVKKEYQKPRLQVQTKNGVVQGTRLTSDNNRRGYYFAYLGIPYAKAPIGSLRFRAPLRAKNWSGVLDASREGAACVGIDMDIIDSSFKLSVMGSEDCLFLNIFTNHNPRKIKHPNHVMVYIHGGAFLTRSASASDHGPDLLVSEDVLVVTLNYRSGIFGSLCTEDMASPGNYGLKDQNLALRWIQQNIENFGGNPNSVTIFGESAGAASVHFHLLSHKSKGLFHRAIMESGSALCHWSIQRKPSNIAYMVGIANGITNPEDSYDLVARLREINLEDLKISVVGSTLATLAMTTRMGLPNSPSIEPEHEEAFLTGDYWYEMLNNGEFNHVPVIMGINANESLFFHRLIEIIKPFLFGVDIDSSLIVPSSMNILNNTAAVAIGKMIIEYYLGPESKFGTIDTYILMQLLNHEIYMRPIRRTALLMSKYVPTFFYYFSHQGFLGANGINVMGHHKNIKGVAHGEELYYIFNKLGSRSKRKSDYVVRNRMVKLWTNFAKYSNPTPKRDSRLNNVIWPAVSPLIEPKLKYLDISETLAVRHVLNEQVHLEWWDDLFQKYAVPPLRNY